MDQLVTESIANSSSCIATRLFRLYPRLATEQITEDVKNVAIQLIRNKCYENIDRCMRVIKEIFTPPPESA